MPANILDLVINDESVVNDRGYSVKNSGLLRHRFDKNPLWLHQHDLNKIVGRCTELRIEGSKLIGKFEVDEGDKEALEVHRKIEAGFLKGVSAGFIIHDMEFLEGVPPVVTSWELVEVSSVTVPSNYAAVKLYSKEGEQLSNEAADKFIEQLSSDFLTSKNNTQEMSKPTNQPTEQPKPDLATLSAKALAELGLSTQASLSEVSQAVERLAAEFNTLKTAVESDRVAKRDKAINKAKLAGKITAEQEQNFKDLYDSNPQLCLSLLDSMQATPSLTDRLAGSNKHTSTSSAPAGFEGTWDQLDRADKLSMLKEKHPDYFKQLYEATFSAEYKG